MKNVKDYINKKTAICCTNIKEYEFIENEIVKCGGKSMNSDLLSHLQKGNCICLDIDIPNHKFLNIFNHDIKNFTLENNYYTVNCGYTVFYAKDFMENNIVEKIEELNKIYENNKT